MTTWQLSMQTRTDRPGGWWCGWQRSYTCPGCAAEHLSWARLNTCPDCGHSLVVAVIKRAAFVGPA